MEILSALIIQIICGALGSNVMGYAIKNISMGIIGNSIIGLLGGCIGGQLIWILTNVTGTGITTLVGIDLNNMLGNVIGGFVGGGSLLVLIGRANRTPDC